MSTIVRRLPAEARCAAVASASKTDLRPVLQHVAVTASEVVGVDGYMLIRYTLPADYQDATQTEPLLVNAATIPAKPKFDIFVSRDEDNQLLVGQNGTTKSAAAGTGSFPTYQSIIPEVGQNHVVFNPDLLERIAKAAKQAGCTGLRFNLPEIVNAAHDINIGVRVDGLTDTGYSRDKSGYITGFTGVIMPMNMCEDVVYKQALKEGNAAA
jgi:hypothetical protein